MKTIDCHKWFAVYTKPRTEKKIFSELSNYGIETYLPLKKELRQWHDRKKWIEIPIISSYIFVRVNNLEYRKVFEVKNFVRYVSYNGRAAPIPDREIDAMKRAVENNLSLSVERGILKKGKTITIASGPLKGITGEITDIKGKKKLYIRVKNAGFSLSINIDDETIL